MRFCARGDKKLNSSRTSPWSFFRCGLGKTSMQSCSYTGGDQRQGNCCCQHYCEASCHHGDLGQNASGAAFTAAQRWPAHQTLSGSTPSAFPWTFATTQLLCLWISQPSTWCKVEGKTGKYSSCSHSTKYHEKFWQRKGERGSERYASL